MRKGPWGLGRGATAGKRITTSVFLPRPSPSFMRFEIGRGVAIRETGSALSSCRRPHAPGPRPSAPASMMARTPFIVLVAGEPSGDNLGAKLIEALRAQLPDARFAGIAGPRMIAAGCEPWERMENLSVMGLFEILPHLPRLLRIRRQLHGTRARRPAGCVRRRRCQGIQSAHDAGVQAAGDTHGAVRESADLGVATGARAHDRPRRGPGLVPAAVRETVLRRACGAGAVRRTSVG